DFDLSLTFDFGHGFLSQGELPAIGLLGSVTGSAVVNVPGQHGANGPSHRLPIRGRVGVRPVRGGRDAVDGRYEQVVHAVHVALGHADVGFGGTDVQTRRDGFFWLASGPCLFRQRVQADVGRNAPACRSAKG